VDVGTLETSHLIVLNVGKLETSHLVMLDVGTLETSHLVVLYVGPLESSDPPSLDSSLLSVSFRFCVQLRYNSSVVTLLNVYNLFLVFWGHQYKFPTGIGDR
jgi:hypothetical protein